MSGYGKLVIITDADVVELRTVLREVDGMLILPWEDPAEVLAARDAYLDETDACPWLGLEPDPDWPDNLGDTDL